MKKNIKSQASLGFFIITVIGILILLNLVSVRIFGRIDLTDGGMYSLSDASKNLMKQLDDQVHAKAYFTSDLPAPYNSHTRFVKDLFEEYSAYSKGKFKFEFINPGEEDDSRNKMMLLGIPPVQIQEIRDDKFEVKQAFLGIVFYYSDKKEVVPVVKSTNGLEYEFTSTIRKLTAEKLKIVGFAQGHDEPDPRQEMKQVIAQVEKNYKVQTVDLSGEKPTIDPNIDTLIIINPQKELEEPALFAIDQFLMKGRTVAFMTDAVNVNLQSFQAKNITNGLDKLTKHLGITINKDLVLDLQNKRINVASQQGMFRVSNVVNYPLIPVITDFDKDNTLTGELDALALPFVSSLQVASDNPNVTYTVLGRSSARSWSQSGMYQINPMQQLTPTADSKTGPFPVIAMAKGKFDSYFTNKLETSKPFLPENPEDILKKSPETRVLVIGDGSFAVDKFGEPTSGIFFTDCVDWLMQDEALISIRGRGLQNKPIAELENWEKSLIKYANVIGIPVLLILFGLFRWQLRRARRRGLQLAGK